MGTFYWQMRWGLPRYSYNFQAQKQSRSLSYVRGQLSINLSWLISIYHILQQTGYFNRKPSFNKAGKNQEWNTGCFHKQAGDAFSTFLMRISQAGLHHHPLQASNQGVHNCLDIIIKVMTLCRVVKKKHSILDTTFLSSKYTFNDQMNIDTATKSQQNEFDKMTANEAVINAPLRSMSQISSPCGSCSQLSVLLDVCDWWEVQTEHLCSLQCCSGFHACKSSQSVN